ITKWAWFGATRFPLFIYRNTLARSACLHVRSGIFC
ncbi:unnamed protein product, partial [Arabidopsis halleri]